MKPVHLGMFETRFSLECSFACKAQTMFQFKCTPSLFYGKISESHSVEGKSSQLLERAQPK